MKQLLLGPYPPTRKFGFLYEFWGSYCGEDSRRGLMGYNVV